MSSSPSIIRGFWFINIRLFDQVSTFTSCCHCVGLGKYRYSLPQDRFVPLLSLPIKHTDTLYERNLEDSLPRFLSCQ